MDIFDKLNEFIYTGIVSGFGGLANYIYYISKGNKPKLSSFIINIILGFFIGNTIGSFIPETFQYRDGILLISGFGLWSILKFFEEDGGKLITNLIKTLLKSPK